MEKSCIVQESVSESKSESESGNGNKYIHIRDEGKLFAIVCTKIVAASVSSSKPSISAPYSHNFLLTESQRKLSLHCHCIRFRM